MFKVLRSYFFQSWLINFVVLAIIIAFAQLYYPIHSWLFAEQWRWASFERSIRFYKACVPASFFVALILTFNEWTELRKKDKAPD